MKYHQAGSAESESLLPLEIRRVPEKLSDGIEDRWQWFDYASLWSGIVICVSGYSIGTLLVIKFGLTILQALTMLAVCGFIAFLLSLLTAAPGYEHRTNTVVLLYRVFGNKGVILPVTVRMMVCCGWFGIHSLFGGMAINLILCSVFPSWMQLGGAGEVVGYFTFILINLIVFRHGIKSLIKLQCFCAPLLLVIGVLLIIWANHTIDFNFLKTAQTEPAQVSDLIQAGVIVCGSWFSFTFFMSDFSQFSRRKSDYIIGQFVGFYLGKLLFGAFGVLLGAASLKITGLYHFDIVSLINEVGSPVARVLGLVIVLMATLTTTVAACLATSSLDLESLVTKITRRQAMLIVSIFATLVALPQLLYRLEMISYGGLISLFTDFLKVYSSVINGLIVIFLINYYVLNKINGTSFKSVNDYCWQECLLSLLLIAFTFLSYLSDKYNFICFYSGFVNIFVVFLGYLLFGLIRNKKQIMCNG
ncbi:cytosine permease [Endozoicomonas gorgoniicola]|uniref:Cytosine permease n=1 Tax=Endozoicomonas gorgoniicola TaxID=1234144 RepID=A0ABT3MWG9_9GAMM|nr:cytosine permease [Endozoicomonas gorgoniicola]MCW7553705.1 cytosine permease [Endozoicomonas gorgoniicola]